MFGTLTLFLILLVVYIYSDAPTGTPSDHLHPGRGDRGLGRRARHRQREGLEQQHRHPARLHHSQRTTGNHLQYR